MWTPTTQRQHSRDGLRYETDLTDAEWAVISPLLPPSPKRKRPPEWTMREILDSIFYVLRGGIAWSLLPNDLPPKSTVFGWFSMFQDRCVFEKINVALVAMDRERVGREASPSAAIIDSQSVKTTESGGPRGYEAGKKIKGRKRISSKSGDQARSCRMTSRNAAGSLRSTPACSSRWPMPLLD